MWPLPTAWWRIAPLPLSGGESSDSPLGLLRHHPIRKKEECLVIQDGDESPGSPHGLHWYPKKGTHYCPLEMKVLAPYSTFSATTLAGGWGISLQLDKEGSLGFQLRPCWCGGDVATDFFFHLVMFDSSRVVSFLKVFYLARLSLFWSFCSRDYTFVGAFWNLCLLTSLAPSLGYMGQCRELNTTSILGCWGS